MASMSYSGNTRTAPRWLADFHSRGRSFLAPAKLNVTQFVNQLGVDVLVNTGGAAQGATSIPVVALTGPGPFVGTLVGTGGTLIRRGSTINFSASGAGNKFALLTADAKVGDTTLTVAAIPAALVAGDDGRWDYTGNIYIPAGIIIGRTFAERTSNVGYGPGDVATPDDELGILMWDVVDALRQNDCEILRVGKLNTIKENYLPSYANLTTPQLTWLRANYSCILGVN